MSSPVNSDEERIKISIFHYNSLNTGAGESRALLNYANNFPKKKFDVTIFQTDYCRIKNLTDEEVNSYTRNVKLVTIRSVMTPFRFGDIKDSNASSISKFLSSTFSLFLKVIITTPFSRIVNRRKTKEAKDSDVVFIYDSEYCGYIPRLRKGLPIVGTFRRDFGGKTASSFIHRLLKPLIILVYSLQVRRVTSFHFLTKRLHDNSPIHRKGDFILHSGVDLKMFHPPENNRTGNLKFLFLARLEKVKGIVETIEAFETLSSKDSELHIAGAGTMQDYVKSRAKNNRRIIYEGFLSGDALVELYRKCDVFVFPTKMSEQHPLVVVEALASGLSVITSNKLKGIFDKFENLGFLKYSYSNTDDLSEMMKESIKNKDSNRKLSLQIAASAKEYDWKTITKELFEKFEDIFNSSA